MSKMQFMIGTIILLASLGISRAASPEFTPEQIRAFSYLPKGTEITQLGNAFTHQFSNGNGTITAIISARLVGANGPAQGGTDRDTGFSSNYSGYSELGFIGGVLYTSVKHVGGVFYAGDTAWTLFSIRESVTERGWVEWNVANIPDLSTINAVGCSTHCVFSRQVSNLRLYDMLSNQPQVISDPVVLYNDAGTGSLYGAYLPPQPGVWNYTALTAQAATDLQSHLSANWFAIGYAALGAMPREVCLEGYDGAFPPRLAVTYTPPGTHDVGMLRILSPGSTVDSGQIQTMQARVKNYGSFTETNVAVSCSINTSPPYMSTRTVGSIPAGDSATVTFDNWVPLRSGAFNMKCSTFLAGDANRANDTLSHGVAVRYKDVGCTQILAPTSADSGVSTSVWARVENYGTVSATFNIRFVIPSAGYDQTLTGQTLPAGVTNDFQFPSWIPVGRDSIAMQCCTILADDMYHLNDTARRRCFVRVADVGCDEILVPVGDLDSVGALSPVAKVKNYGNVNVTTPFNVGFTIGGWSGTKQVASLNAGDSVALTFDTPSWGCPRGPYAGTCSTQMNGDRNPNDDAKTASGFVRVADVGCDRILTPVGDLDSVGALSPVAKVKNYGNTNVTSPFDVLFSIGGWSSTKQVSSLNAGDSVTLTFDTPSWGCPRGTYSATCSTRMGGDRIPGNDAKTSSGTVSVSDVGALAIVEPFGSDTVGVPVTPQVRAQNFGTADATCDLRLLILGPAHEVLYNHTEVGVLVPISGPIVRDFSVQWTPTVTGLCSLWAFTAMAGDVNHTNDTAHGSCLVRNPVVHDVATLTIVAPTGTVDTMPRVPQAEVKNLGEVAETFLAWYRILDPTGTQVYYDSARATGLAPNAQLVLGFPVWTGHHPPGAYLARCSTALAGDIHPGNDAIQDTFTVALLGPALWNQMADVLQGGKRKNVKDGACLASAREAGDDTSYVYAFKGNNTHEFYRYNAARNDWSSRDSIPAVGRSPKKKGVKKGATLVQAGNGRLYATKGNNTYDWWQYIPGVGGLGSGVWVQREDVPNGSKAVREGTGSVAVVENGGNYVYLLKGSGTYEFYRYDADNGAWQAMADAPFGNSHKPFKNGSCLTYDGVDTIYCLKGSYNEFFAYSISGKTWTTRETLPRVYPSGTSKKKVKDGAGIAAVGRTVYALKGANTNEFWGYDCNQHRWNPLTQMPTRTKRVKGGGALVYVAGAYSLYAFRGNNTREFWSYGPVTADRYPLSADAEPKDVQGTAGGDVRAAELRISPNPFRASISPAIYYSLPVAGDVSLRLYDVSGKLVSVLATGYRPAGSYSLRTVRGSPAKGVYLLAFEGGGLRTTSKLVVE